MLEINKPKKIYWGVLLAIASKYNLSTTALLLLRITLLVLCFAPLGSGLVIYFILWLIIRNYENDKILKDKGLIVRAKNYSELSFLVLPILLIVDIIIWRTVGEGNDYVLPYLVIPTLIGGGLGAFSVWWNNSFMKLELYRDHLIFQNSRNEIYRIKKNDIRYYSINKDNSKSTIRFDLKDNSSISLTSYFLNLNDVESHIKPWIGDVLNKQQRPDNVKNEEIKDSDKLIELKSLFDKGILSKKEYEEQKRKILNRF